MRLFNKLRRKQFEAGQHDDEKDASLERLERAAARMGLLKERERLQQLRAQRHQARGGH